VRFAIEVAPPYSMVLVMDPSVGQIPESFSGRLVAATSSCIALGTCPEVDGPTQITLGDTPPSGAARHSVFDGHLETPAHRIEVQSALCEVLLGIDVPGDLMRVRIWVNDQRWPDAIDILATLPDGMDAGQPAERR